MPNPEFYRHNEQFIDPRQGLRTGEEIPKELWQWQAAKIDVFTDLFLTKVTLPEYPPLWSVLYVDGHTRGTGELYIPISSAANHRNSDQFEGIDLPSEPFEKHPGDEKLRPWMVEDNAKALGMSDANTIVVWEGSKRYDGFFISHYPSFDLRNRTGNHRTPLRALLIDHTTQIPAVDKPWRYRDADTDFDSGLSDLSLVDALGFRTAIENAIPGLTLTPEDGLKQLCRTRGDYQREYPSEI